MASITIDNDINDTNDTLVDDVQVDEPQESKGKVTITTGKKKQKGRGFKRQDDEDEGKYSGKGGKFESIDASSGRGNAQKSIEGWIVFVSGIHEEAQEDELYDLFADYGVIKQIHLNLDRRTGYVKGYALIEFGEYSEAETAIKALDGQDLLNQTIHVEWAFKKPVKGSSSSSSRRKYD